MKALRVTMYHTPTERDTVVVLETDLQIPVEVAAEDMEKAFVATFVVSEVLEMPAGTTLEDAAHRGRMRLQDSARALEEQNMAVCFYHNAKRLAAITPRGTLASSVAAPLSAKQLEYVIRQLKHHPNYLGQRIVQFDRHMTAVLG